MSKINGEGWWWWWWWQPGVVEVTVVVGGGGGTISLQPKMFHSIISFIDQVLMKADKPKRWQKFVNSSLEFKLSLNSNCQSVCCNQHKHLTCDMRNVKCDMWHNYKYSLLSIDMKTKVVQHFLRIIFNVFMFSSFQSCHSCHMSYMSNVKCQMLMLIIGTCWTIFVFMSMIKTQCL